MLHDESIILPCIVSQDRDSRLLEEGSEYLLQRSLLFWGRKRSANDAFDLDNESLVLRP